jgi:hypothetical protein
MVSNEVDGLDETVSKREVSSLIASEEGIIIHSAATTKIVANLTFLQRSPEVVDMQFTRRRVFGSRVEKGYFEIITHTIIGDENR